MLKLPISLRFMLKRNNINKMKNSLFTKVLIFFALSTVLLSSCSMSESKYNDKIKEMEDALNADTTKIPAKEDVIKLIDSYVAFVEKFPKSDIAPEYLFRAGRYCMSYQLPTKAIEFFDKIINNYPDYIKTPDSYFLKAFVYDSQLSNIPMARKSYEELIKKYPNHELALQAQELLKILGKNLNDIIAEFETKNNAEKSDELVEE